GIFVPLRLSPPAMAVRGLEHAFTLARCATGARRLLSTPSFGEPEAWLGVGSDRGPGRSPNLTGATPGVSPGGLKSSSPLCLPISPPGRGRRCVAPASGVEAWVGIEPAYADLQSAA